MATFKKAIFVMILIGILIPLFASYETARAEAMNSKAGIKFSNGYMPDTKVDPSVIPDGSPLPDTSSDSQLDKKILPKTGNSLSISYIYIGVGSILIALVILIALARNNRENRNES